MQNQIFLEPQVPIMNQEPSDDSNLINDFYGSQFLDIDAESTYLTNNQFLDDLVILVGLEYHHYFAPRDRVHRNHDFIGSCVPQTSMEQFC